MNSRHHDEEERIPFEEVFRQLDGHRCEHEEPHDAGAGLERLMLWMSEDVEPETADVSSPANERETREEPSSGERKRSWGRRQLWNRSERAAAHPQAPSGERIGIAAAYVLLGVLAGVATATLMVLTDSFWIGSVATVGAAAPLLGRWIVSWLRRRHDLTKAVIRYHISASHVSGSIRQVGEVTSKQVGEVTGKPDDDVT